MKEIVLFGAGKIGQESAKYYIGHGEKVAYFIDNDQSKWGSTIADIPVISLEQYGKIAENYRLMLSCNKEHEIEIKKQLNDKGFCDFSRCDEYWNRERIVSYSHPNDREDIILYHVLHDNTNIFFIDVGSNDPVLSSVTKLLYDKGAHGINIEPLKDLYCIALQERERDVNLCVGLGENPGRMNFYVQGELSTVVEENVSMQNCGMTQIEVTTLADVCAQYVEQGQEIAFLKVDVEGAEKSVLLGADFQVYRPWIIIMESTLSNTMIPCYESWEYILLENNYHFVYSYGVNRYYVADEKAELDNRFIGMDLLCAMYKIFTANYKRLEE